MKSIIALATIAMALSLCNLMGRRGNTNDNATNRPSGTSSEATESPSPDKGSQPPVRPDAPPPPPSINEGLDQRKLNAAPPSAAQATPRPAPKTISGGVLNGKATHLPKPAYPAIAKAAHASGAVHVQVLIDEKGNVLTASAVSGHPLLKASAVGAARQAKFSPTVLSGQPVKVSGIIIYNFVE
jgi:periplasmic protein TonB